MKQTVRRLATIPVGSVSDSAPWNRQTTARAVVARIGAGPAGERRKRPDHPAVLGAAFPQRSRADQLQGAGHRVAERLRLEPHPTARAFQQPAASFDLLLQVLLPLAGGFELLGRDAPPFPVEVRRLDLPCEAYRVPVADAAAKAAFDVVVDHLGEAAELPLDGLGLAYQHLQNPVLGALREHEVVAAHPRRRLQLAVDASVALLDAARIPGQIEVEQIGAVRLEVQPLAGGVGGEEDAQRIARRVGVEAALDLPALRSHGLPVDGLDTFLGEVGPGDGLLEHGAEIPLRADDVLREDEHPALVPARQGAGAAAEAGIGSGAGAAAGRPLAARREIGAEVLADPVDQAAGLGVREAAGGGRRLLHPVEQGLLLAPDRLRPRVPTGRAGRTRLGGGVEGGDLRGFLGRALVLGVLGALVVRVRGACEPAGAGERIAVVRPRCLARRRFARPCLDRRRYARCRPFPLPSHRRSMPREGDGERLDGRQQLLLQAHYEQGGGGPSARRTVLQAFLSQAAVLVEKAGENELRRVLRQALDGDAPHVSLGKAALDLAEVLLDAPHHHLVQRVLSPDRHPPGEAVRVQQLEQGGEAVGVAVVGRGGQEQAVLEAASEIADRAGEPGLDPVTPAARRRGVMGFVQDQEAARQQVAQPFAQGVRVGRIDEQVVRHEKAAVGTPRVDAEAPLLANPREIRTVEDHEEEAEALLHLGLPLLQYGRGRGGDDGLRLLAKQQLAGDESGLDGLAETGVVGDEEVDPGHSERLPERLHLVGVDLDAGAKRRLEEVRVGGGDAVPAKGVKERTEVAGRVEAPGADGAPRLLLEDAAVDLEVPVDLQGLPLGIIVGAREADAR